MSLTVTETARLLRQRAQGLPRKKGQTIWTQVVPAAWYAAVARQYGVAPRYVRWRVTQARTVVRQHCRTALPVTKVNVATVAAQYDAGMGVYELADLYGVSSHVIDMAVFQAVDEGIIGRRRRKSAVVPWSRQRIAALAATGHSNQGVADLVGCHRTTVYRVRRETRRRKSGARNKACEGSSLPSSSSSGSSSSTSGPRKQAAAVSIPGQ